MSPAVPSRRDTIAAIATAPGRAALGIVRVSGRRAREVLSSLVPGSGAADRPRRMTRGRAADPRSGRVLDEVLCFFAPGPRTATGEDVAEIHAHGGPLVLRSILDAALAAGARVAEPGEFTYRAFLHGRLDLTQAEAVRALIEARTERAARTALGQLEGAIGSELAVDLEELAAISAEVEAGLDFPDEDLPASDCRRLAGRLDAIREHLEKLAAGFGLGRRLEEGACAVLAGPVNAGKSSLLNRLAGAERVLVDPEPGTTRDVIEVRAEVHGVPLSLRDTAGLRSSPGRIERRGIDLAREWAARADVILFVIDAAAPRPDRETEELIRALLEAAPGDARALLVLNKCDLPGWSDAPPARLERLPRLRVSALSGEGTDHLLDEIGNALRALADEEPLITTARQHAALDEAARQLDRAARTLSRYEDPELAADDLRLARTSLAALWGRDAEREVLDALFSRFCLGK
ncbi:MAG: tRNA uridine-5-carboxymethylaminomethyl(34) synthesis GTPase MnmE [Polyangia bacterium]